MKYKRVNAHIIDKWDLSINQSMPIYIPDTTRRTLRQLFAELGFREGVEIGVNNGSNALKLNRSNPECALYCVDPWETYPGMDSNQVVRDESYLIAEKFLGPIPNVHIMRMSSMEALSNFEDRSLDFVYIDGDHEFPFVAEDIFYWAKKVKKGGIVSGHDYNQNHRAHEYTQVKEVVDAYTKAFNITPWFIMNEAIYPEHPGNFLWVKQ